MIALLSLGRDLGQGTPEEAAAVEASTTTSVAPKRPPPQPILPATLASKPSKKRQKKAVQVGPTSVPNPYNAQAGGGYQYPPDFWYWLPPGESVGEWDVLVSSDPHHVVAYPPSFQQSFSF
jgi:hypothetical protein